LRRSSDIAGDSLVLDVGMRSTGPPPAVAAEVLEREYEAHRGAVLAMLRSEFPRLADHEEYYQQAWAELLERLATGEAVEHRRALLKKIAWRRAVDALRRGRWTHASDPAVVARAVVDEALTPEEQAELRLDAEALRLIVESLDERQATVLKLRFDQHLTTSEIQRRLGLSPKRLEKIVTAAYKQIAAQLETDGVEDSRWRRHQRSLLLACEVGIASPKQRRLAKDMLDRDAGCRAMLREMRAALHNVAAALPMPIVADQCERTGVVGRAFGRLDEAWLGLRQLAETVSGRAASSGAAEQATLGGATLSAGAATKAVIACLAVGGAATVCLTQGGRPKEPPTAEARAPKAHATQRKQIERVALKTTPVVQRKHVTQKNAAAKPAKKASSTPQPQVPVSSPASTPPASPAPTGSTEFGPGNVGSTQASQQSAAAPQDGGGEFTP
jgi:RNA polymerase sigma factor (sigma-70 family)